MDSGATFCLILGWEVVIREFTFDYMLNYTLVLFGLFHIFQNKTVKNYSSAKREIV